MVAQLVARRDVSQSAAHSLNIRMGGNGGRGLGHRINIYICTYTYIHMHTYTVIAAPSGATFRRRTVCWSIGRGGCVPGWCKAGVSVGFSQWYPGVSWGIRGYPGCGRTGTPEKHIGKQALRSNWQGYPVLVLRLNIILKGISEGSAPIFLGSAPIGISRILRDLFPPVKGTKSAQLPPPRPKTDLSPSRCIFLWADQPIKKIS